jgi:hypothetical protein
VTAVVAASVVEVESVLSGANVVEESVESLRPVEVQAPARSASAAADAAANRCLRLVEVCPVMCSKVPEGWDGWRSLVAGSEPHAEVRGELSRPHSEK